MLLFPSQHRRHTGKPQTENIVSTVLVIFQKLMVRKWLHVTGAINGTTFPVKESQQMSSRTPKFHGHAVNVIRLAYACVCACYVHACRLNVIQVTSFFSSTCRLYCI